MHHPLAALSNMLICAAGIYGCFFYWGVLQERVSTKPYLVDGEPKKFKFFWVLSFAQAAFAAVFSAALLSAQTVISASARKHLSSPTSYPWRQLVTIGITVLVGPQFGYAAMSRLPYPVVVTVKMCKMIPILFVGVFWHRQRYPIAKVLNVFAITAGVVGMVLLAEEKHHHDPEAATSWIALLMVAVNLILDGYTNSTQDSVAKVHKLSGTEIMLGTNVAVVALSAAYLIGLEVFVGLAPEVALATTFAKVPEVSSSAAFFVAAPAALWDIVQMGTLNAVGQFFIFRAIGLFGSLTMTAITLTRKVGSVFISIYANDHELVPAQWFSLSLVVLGVLADAWLNIRGKPKVKSS